MSTPGDHPAATPGRLPRGRHGLSRAEVERSQRDRMLVAMADAMSEKGFARASVQDVIKRAGVSRESFYRLFTSKQDCFLAAFDRAGEELLKRITEGDVTGGDPVDRFQRLFGAYLDALASQPAWARLFLVEVHAAGPEAIARRLELQREFVQAIAGLLGAGSESGRFACQLIVSATSAMLTGPLVVGDLDALRAIGPPVVEHVRLLAERGVFR
ncbi:MAG: TetR/AcrR family transcriptional regulator [Haloechinothrix sp.]